MPTRRIFRAPSQGLPTAPGQADPFDATYLRSPGPLPGAGAEGCDLARQEVADRGRDVLGVCLQCEVTGVEKADEAPGRSRLKVWRRAGEERVVLTPRRQQRRLVRAEVGLERGVQRNVGRVIQNRSNCTSSAPGRAR